MSSSKRSIHLLDEFQPPPKRSVSEADLFIKELAKKQKNTAINLNQELANVKEFCKGEELVSLGHYLAGTSSLSEFQELAKDLEHIGLLKGAGLTEYDIQLYMDYLKGEEYFLNQHKNSEKSVLLDTINKIREVILVYKKERQTIKLNQPSIKLPNSERIDPALLVKPCNDTTKLYQFALENEKLKNSKCFLPSPMDNIKQIEQVFLKSLESTKFPNISQIRRKARKLHNRLHNVTEQSEGIKKSKTTEAIHKHNNPYVSDSKWDEKTRSTSQVVNKPKQLYGCLPQNYYTIKDGVIVKLTKPECEARNLSPPERLTIEEIKQLPKFQDYEEGNPTKVLYLKNLSNSVKESDLKDVFKMYDIQHNVTYKIMRGKMRGQAFVTFIDEVVALQALRDVNGVFVKNKPVVIQFGHGKD